MLGEFFRGRAAGGAVLGELFRGSVSGRAVLGGFFRGNAAGGAVLGEFFSRKCGWRGRVGRVLSRTGSRGIPRGELCCAVALVVSPSTGSVNPSIRSYTHLV